MITHPALILTALIAVEAAVLYAASHNRTKHLFRFLPPVFWIYFLPMLASTAGLITAQSPVYSWSMKFLLPASLFLLLIGVDVKAIARLGRKALILFLTGSFGIIIGTVVTFFIFKNFVGPQFWSGFGALSGSWMGGSANMVAVKEAVGTPEDIFLPMVVVDTVVPYVWMGLLIAASGWQEQIDTFNRADRRLLDQIREHLRTLNLQSGGLTLSSTGPLAVLALGISWLFARGAGLLPVVAGVISSFAWTIILISLAGLAGSFTPLRRLENHGASRLGYFLLYFVLTTIGVKASLSQLGTSFILIAAGAMIVVIHAGILFLAARVLKAPVMLAAAASQANIGGVASGPVVAEVYQPGLSAIGLLMAVLGNILGTYFGIITAQVCRIVSGY